MCKNVKSDDEDFHWVRGKALLFSVSRKNGKTEYGKIYLPFSTERTSLGDGKIKNER